VIQWCAVYQFSAYASGTTVRANNDQSASLILWIGQQRQLSNVVCHLSYVVRWCYSVTGDNSNQQPIKSFGRCSETLKWICDKYWSVLRRECSVCTSRTSPKAKLMNLCHSAVDGMDAWMIDSLIKRDWFNPLTPTVVIYCSCRYNCKAFCARLG